MLAMMASACSLESPSEKGRLTEAAEEKVMIDIADAPGPKSSCLRKAVANVRAFASCPRIEPLRSNTSASPIRREHTRTGARGGSGGGGAGGGGGGDMMPQ